MSRKNKKKRNKPYRGADAANQPPAITRVKAVNRNFISQWWLEKKKIAKPILIAVAVVTFIVWLLISLFRAF